MTTHSIKASAIKGALLLILLFVSEGSLRATPLVSYNFDSLTAGDLGGQDGWATVATRSSSSVIAGPAGSLNTSEALSNGALSGVTPVINSKSFFAAGTVTSGSILTMSIDVYAGAANSIEYFGIGLSGYSGNPSAQFGVFNGIFSIRGESNGTIYNAVNSSGAAISITTGSWYRLQSVWDLSTGTATLSYLNLTAGETAYTSLYFDAAQTTSSVSLGITSTVANWTTGYVRMGNSSGNGIGYLDNISVVPEPTAFSFMLLGLCLVVYRCRASTINFNNRI